MLGKWCMMFYECLDKEFLSPCVSWLWRLWSEAMSWSWQCVWAQSWENQPVKPPTTFWNSWPGNTWPLPPGKHTTDQCIFASFLKVKFKKGNQVFVQNWMTKYVTLNHISFKIVCTLSCKCNPSLIISHAQKCWHEPDSHPYCTPVTFFISISL